MKVRVSNGKYFLIGGKPALFNPGSVALTSSLTLIDFYRGNASSLAVVQRSAATRGSTLPTANVRVRFSCTGAQPQAVNARVVRVSTAAVVMAGVALSSVNFVGNEGVGTLMNVPQGGDYRLEIYDPAQPSNPATTSAGGAIWGVGVCGLLIGQSNQVSLLGAGYYNQGVPGKGAGEFDYANSAEGRSRFSFFGDCGFHGASAGYNGPTGSSGGSNTANGGVLGFARILANQLEAKYGYPVPVCISPWAQGQTGQEQWDPETQDGWLNKLLFGSGTSGNDIGFKSPVNFHPGDFEWAAEHQGEANSNGTRAAMFNALKGSYLNILAYLAPYGRTSANFGFFPSMLGVYGNLGGIEKIRGAVLDFENWAKANGYTNAEIGLNCIDLDPSDGGDQALHFRDTNQPYASRGIRRQLQSVSKFLGCSTVSGVGPRIGTVSRSGLTVNVAINHEAGSAQALVTRAGGAPTGFYANSKSDFTGIDTAVTAAITSGSNIAVTANDGSSLQGRYLKYMGGADGTAQSYYPNITNAVYNTFSYPTGATGSDLYTGLPLLPTPDAILVP